MTSSSTLAFFSEGKCFFIRPVYVGDSRGLSMWTETKNHPERSAINIRHGRERQLRYFLSNEDSYIVTFRVFTKWVRRSVCLGVKESVAAGRISGSSSRPSRNARIGQSVALNWMECLIVRWACLVYGNSSWMTSDKNDIVVVDDLQVHFCANNDDSFLALHTCIHCWSWARTISMFVCIMNEEDTKISVCKQPKSIDDSFGCVMVLLVTRRSGRSRPCSIIL